MNEKEIKTIRPLDILMNKKGEEIKVELKSGKIFKGKLKAFDIHINLVLYEATEILEDKEKEVGNIFIRGDTVVYLKL